MNLSTALLVGVLAAAHPPCNGGACGNNTCAGGGCSGGLFNGFLTGRLNPANWVNVAPPTIPLPWIVAGHPEWVNVTPYGEVRLPGHVAPSEPFVPGGPAPKGPANIPPPKVLDANGKEELPPQSNSLFQRLGGEQAIQAVVDDLLSRAARNPKVNFTRKGTPAEWQPFPDSVAALNKHMVEMISAATGGPAKYAGRDMKTAHKGMAITDAEFDALAGDLKATLDHFKVPLTEQGELLKIVESTRKDIVEKPK